MDLVPLSPEPFQRCPVAHRADVLLESCPGLPHEAHPDLQQHQPSCPPQPLVPAQPHPCPVSSVLSSLSHVPASPALCQAPSLCSQHSCVCLAHPEVALGVEQ